MDGRQVMAANNNLAANNSSSVPKSYGNYHYGANNGESSLDLIESAFQVSRSNSIQFIDSDGCPTDANIMGPLIKMDSTGQRLLAPFDAFKFPTSDMVFFRAVVSSCVSECKPSVCAPTLLEGANTPDDDLTTRQMATSSMPPSTPTAQPSFRPPAIRPSVPSSNRMTTLAQASSTGATGRPTTSAGLSTKTTPASARQTTLSHYSSLANTDLNTQASGDSLTTIPGYGQPDPMQTSESNEQMNTDSANGLELQRGQVVNVTNNHQQGRPVAPKPNIFTAVNDRHPPVNLSSLTNEQRRQIVNLFETRLKQPLPVATAAGSSGIADMADLYTGFLQEIMLKDKSLLHMMPSVQERKTNWRVGEQASSPLAASGVDDLLANLSADGNELQPRGNQTLLNAELLAELSSILHEAKIGSNNEIVPPKIGADNKQHADRMSLLAVAKARADPKLSNPKHKKDKFDLHQIDANSQPSHSRAKRQAESARLVAPAYVQMAESIRSAPETPAGGVKFTKVFVELYHTGSEEVARRRKRAVEPRYEMDELVVQSIKIHDRLQFHPDSHEKPSRSARSKSYKSALQSQKSDRSQQAEEPTTRYSILTNSGALSMVVVAISFVSLQIFLVLMCLVDWNRRRLRHRVQSSRNNYLNRQVCYTDPQSAADSASLSSYYESTCSTNIDPNSSFVHSFARGHSGPHDHLYLATQAAALNQSAQLEGIEQQSIYLQVPRRPNWLSSNRLP